MVLSLQAIDFLLASSIHDGWPLSDGCMGDDDGEEGGATFFRSHLSGSLMGLDSG